MSNEITSEATIFYLYFSANKITTVMTIFCTLVQMK